MSASTLSPQTAGLQESKPSILIEIQNRLTPEGTRLTWEPLCLGGSEREFFRVRSPDQSWVLMHYTDSREENSLYADIALHLQTLSLNVPQLIFHDPEQKWIGLQDLGDTSLFTVVQESQSRESIQEFYLKTLEHVHLLHQETSVPVKTMPGFDDKLYQWERNYFMEHFVRGWAGVELSDNRLRLIEGEGSAMAGELTAIPRCMIHRDFQSQNLMIHDRKVWFIDFQGLRLGHAAYDVASLLYDPYVSLPTDLRSSLLKTYSSISLPRVSKDAFESQFYRAAVQRLMQALGAYGFLGLVKGKKHFLKHIPQGIANLADALNHLHGMPETSSLVKEILSRMPPPTEHAQPLRVSG